MTKPISNAPVNMQPWVDATDAQLTDLEDAVHRLEVNGTKSAALSNEVSSGVNSTLSFNRSVDDGASVQITNATLDGKSYANTSFEVDGPLYIGKPYEESVESGVDADGLPAYLIKEIPVVKIDPSFPRTEVQARSLNAKIPLLNAAVVSDGFTLDVNMNTVNYNQEIGIYDIVGDGTTATVRATDNLYWFSTYYTVGTPIAIMDCGNFDTKAVTIESIVTDTEFGYFSFTFSSDVVETFSGGELSRFIFALNAGSLPINEEARISMSRPAPNDGYVAMTPGGFYTGLDDANITTTISADTGVNTWQLRVGGGYGSTGTTIDDSGNITTNGYLDVDSSVRVGGGYGSTGTTLGSNGSISADGNLIVDGTSTLYGITRAVTSNYVAGTSGSGVRLYASNTASAIGGFRPIVAGAETSNDFLYNSTNLAWNSDVALSTAGRGDLASTQAAGAHISNIGWGIFSRSGASTPLSPQLYLHIYGTTGTARMVQFLYNGNNNGTINVASGGTPAFAAGSDYRMKEDIQPVTDALERMKGIQAYTFRKIKEVDPEQNLQTGFIAHEVAAVHPEAVIGEKDAVDEDGNPEYQQVMDAKLTPLMAQAIKELIEKNEALEARIAALEAR